MNLSNLKMDLQFFADGEVEAPEEDFSKYITEDGGLDVDSLVNDYKDSEIHDENHQEFVDDADNSEKGQGGPDVSHEEGSDVPDVDEEPEESEEPEEPEDETHVNQDKPTKKTPDAAFAELRRRAEANEKLANWVAELAKKQGFSDPEQLIEAFNRQQLAKEAQEKGVPVDVYERLQKLEEENRMKDEQMFRERFNMEVAAAKEKYNLTDDQITDTFRFMAQRGYIDENGRAIIPFEDAYTLANKDTFITQAKEQAKQEYLKELEQKQKQTAPDPKTGAADANHGDDIDLSTEAIFATLEQHGIDWQ